MMEAVIVPEELIKTRIETPGLKSIMSTIREENKSLHLKKKVYLRVCVYLLLYRRLYLDYIWICIWITFGL